MLPIPPGSLGAHFRKFVKVVSCRRRLFKSEQPFFLKSTQLPNKERHGSPNMFGNLETEMRTAIQ